jgi:CDP-diacylglycerol--glycerol-3-phosphate 3-phosphatidyltransferase
MTISESRETTYPRDDGVIADRGRTMKTAIPNILTVLRIALCLIMFGAFYLMFEGLHGRVLVPMIDSPGPLAWTILVSFYVAAITDFLDGYLARRWNVVSTLGAVLDPIADKILVCGAIIGLIIIQGPLRAVDESLGGWIIIPGTLILFREFAVSAMREVLAPKGIKLPVTFFAKMKTTLQLLSIAALILFIFWPAWGLPQIEWLQQAINGAKWMFALASLVTVWTGIEYAMAAAKALKEARAAA